jgi:hypothetical protein
MNEVQDKLRFVNLSGLANEFAGVFNARPSSAMCRTRSTN